MRFLFRPPAAEATDLLTLPWERPLEEWDDPRMLEIHQRGISRHVVRFVAEGGKVYALKEIAERLARREYHLLTELQAQGLPAVSVLGICVERPDDQEAILVTRYLEYSVSYRFLFSSMRMAHSSDQLIDAMVELLARLHLAGLFWGDCTLSNTLFSPDAGTMAAYLVDAETAELHASLTPGQRAYDVEMAAERVGGELMDLESGGLLPDDVDPIVIADEIPKRYEALWQELTREEVFKPEEQRFRVASRLRRLNELGFDVDEVELITSEEGSRLRVTTRVAESGHHRQQLFRLTGLEAHENQARRLLNDIYSFRAYLEQRDGRPVSDSLAGHLWRTEVYEPVIAAIPEHLVGRLAPAEIFHEVLEHRWFLSEQAQRDVGTTAAAESYFAGVLPYAPEAVTAPAMIAEKPAAT
jgi:tRNA A-37 threonylcarbamoyl transferase component Bud32